MALMHNLKHNRVLHETNVILTVRTEDRPWVPEDERLIVAQISADFWRIEARWGYMELPNVPRALAASAKQGLKLDIMNTSFFLGRRTVVLGAKLSMPLWQDRLFIILSKNASDPAAYYRLPPGRVVEMGSQVSI